jgi:hypothetical protein
VKTESDSLATALYVKTDDLLTGSPQLTPWRPAVGIVPQLSDAELVTRAVMQAMLGFTSEACWIRHAHAHLPERAGAQLFKPLRQVNETFKGQLDLERHRGRTPGGVIVRVLQRILALTAAIWHNDHTGQPVMRALTAHDH